MIRGAAIESLEISGPRLNQPNLEALAALREAYKDPQPVVLPDERAQIISVLFVNLSASMERYAGRLMGDPLDGEDMTQFAFEKAFKKLDGALAKGNFQPQAWPYRIVTNSCLDELRHRRLLKFGPLPDRQDLAPVASNYGANPVREFEKLETADEVETTLEGLPERYRRAIELRELYGMGYEEIADEMGTTRTAVKTLLLRAREDFRETYAKKHPHEAAEARGDRVYSRKMGRPSEADEKQAAAFMPTISGDEVNALWERILEMPPTDRLAIGVVLPPSAYDHIAQVSQLLDRGERVMLNGELPHLQEVLSRLIDPSSRAQVLKANQDNPHARSLIRALSFIKTPRQIEQLLAGVS